MAKGAGKIKYKDWLVNMGDVILLTGKGTNPFGKIRENVENIVRQTLEIDQPKFYLNYLAFDVSDGGFRGKWKARKPVDRWTNLWYEVILWGQQDVKTKNGWFKMKIIGWIETSYYYAHSLQKSLWWTYSFFFYNKLRTKILEEGQGWLFEIEDKFRVLLEMPTTQHPNMKTYA